MAKTFKRIVALTAVIALVVCFAVSASAEVTVTTTTQYVSTSDTSNVMVNVTVSGEEITNGTEVTYYAFDGNNIPVYIDQTTAGATAATFRFQTTAGKLNSSVRVGYEGAAAAEEAKIDGYKVTVINGTADISYIPNQGVDSVTVNVIANAEYESVSVKGAAYEIQGTGTNFAVVLSDITGNVTITLQGASSNVVATALEAGYKYDETENTRMVTVLGVAKNAEKFGVIITKETISENYSEEDFAALTDGIFEAKTETTDTGVFAVQVIDVCEEGNEFFEVGAQYNTAVYVQNSDGSYTTHATNAVTIQ